MAVETSTRILRAQLLARLSAETRRAALEAVREILTEENTDAVIAIVVERLPLPFWLRWLPVRAVLDRLLPGTLLRVLEELLEDPA